MGRASRWAVRKPWWAVGVWVLVLIIIGVLAGTLKGDYKDTFNLPDTESTTATDLLSKKFPQTTAATATIVFKGDQPITSPAVKAKVEALLAQAAANPSVTTVVSPYVPGAALQGLVSPNGTIGRARVVFAGEAQQVSKPDIAALVANVEAANTGGLEVGVGGQVIDFASTEPPKSEGVGVLVAIVIMLIMFGSLVAAGLPILTALIGLGAGISLVTVAANFTDIATFGPTLAAMIGLGVGIDYALFVINRYRQAVLVGRDTKDAALEAVNTAGRAVMFAGTTVVIALAGLFVLGISFMNGLAVGAGITVIMVMLTAVTLLPAVMSLLGKKTFAIKMPWARHPKPTGQKGGFARYSSVIQRRPWLFGGLAIVVMLALAAPTLSMRLGFPDASGKAEGTTTRIAYDLTTQGFGAGANGPFLVVATLPQVGQVAGAQKLSAELAKVPGVVAASPVVPNTPSVSPDGTTALIQVQPATGPQDAATSELLATLRNDVIPQATSGTGVHAYVGGATAVTEDFSLVLSKALPMFLLVVVSLGFLALMVLFRSLLVPLTAALTSLLSLGAALGATVAVFQWGNFRELFGVTATGPILPFLPVMLFAILFGLSMDYQVFLVSRMQEEWTRTHNNRLSVRRGLIGSGRVVAAAAAIMFSVFISFVFGDDNTIKMFGLSLAIAIALDAFIIRLVFVPSLMTVLGKANWYLPDWLSRILPAVHIESEEEAAEIVDPLADAEPEGAATR